MIKYLYLLIYMFLIPSILFGQDNFGLSIGLKDYYVHSNVSGRYDGVDISLGINNNVINIPVGIFYEFNIPSINSISVTTSLSTNNQNFFVSPQDYMPPENAPISPYEQAFVSRYRSYFLSFIPSLIIKRNIEYRIGVGYALNYMYHKDNDGLRPYDAGERWLSDPNNQKLLEFADEIVRNNPIKNFTHQLVGSAELRFWHMGIEAKYVASLQSVYEPVSYKGEFIYPFTGYSSAFSLSLKYYFRSILTYN